MGALSLREMEKPAGGGPYKGSPRKEVMSTKIKKGIPFILGQSENGRKVIGVDYDSKKGEFFYKASQASKKIESVSITKVFKDRDFGGGASGSGGGAQETAINESMQCYYCSLVFNIKRKKIDGASDKELSDAASWVYTDISLKDCLKKAPEAWIADQVYVKTANKLWEKYGSKVSGKTYWHRGSNVMKGIYALKKKVQDADKKSDTPQAPGSFNDDKWNPGDIWMTSKNSVPFEESNDWATLNEQVYKAASGTITALGISLKRIGKGAAAKITEYNKPKTDKKLAKFSAWKFGKRGDFFSSQDVYFETSSKDIQFRTFGGDTSWQGEIKGEAAAGGRIGGGNVDFYMKEIAGTGIFGGYSNESSLINAMRSDRNHAEKMYDIYSKVYKKGKGGQDLIPKGAFIETWNSNTSNFRNSKSICLYFLEQFEKLTKDKKDQLVGKMFLYAASSSDQSSYFIKVD